VDEPTDDKVCFFRRSSCLAGGDLDG